MGSIYHRQGFWYIRVITKLLNSEHSYKRYTMGAMDYNTIYRDLIYNGPKGRRRAKAINNGFDITWVGGQHTMDRRELDMPRVGAVNIFSSKCW